MAGIPPAVVGVAVVEAEELVVAAAGAHGLGSGSVFSLPSCAFSELPINQPINKHIQRLISTYNSGTIPLSTMLQFETSHQFCNFTDFNAPIF